MATMPVTRLFISYARVDETTVGRLSENLRSAGATVWFAPTSLSPTESSWQNAIHKGIKDTDIFVYVASEEAANSENVIDEIDWAKHYHIPIVAFWVRGDVWVSCRPSQLSQHLYIDARRDRYRNALDELLYWLELSPTYPESPGSSRRQPGYAPPSEASSPFGPQRTPFAGKYLTPHGRLTNAKIDAALKEAESFQAQGHIDEAVDVCESLIAHGALRADVRYLLGFLYQAVERWSDAMREYMISRYDRRYAVLSCYALGQCARSLGDMKSALEYFDDAIDQLETDELKERDADQLIQMCYEAAHAHRDIGDVAGCDEIFAALLDYLYGQGWAASINQARHLKNETLKNRWPLRSARRSITESRPLHDKLPQRRIDAQEYFEGPRPGWRGPANLRRPDESGVWRTPAKVPVVKRGGVTIYTTLDDSDNETKPIEVVHISSGDKPADQIAQVVKDIFGPQGNLHDYLDNLPLRPREELTRGLRQIEWQIRSNQLTASCGICLKLIAIVPLYHDITRLLAEIYVRQGTIEQSIQQYVSLAERCLSVGDRSKAISVLERLLELDAENLSYRNKLNELLAQQSAAQQPARDLSSIAPGATMEASSDEPISKAAHSADSRTNSPNASSRSDGTLSATSLVEPDAVAHWNHELAHDQAQHELTRPAPDDASSRIELAEVDIASRYVDGGAAALRALAALYEQRGAMDEVAQVNQQLAEMAWAANRGEDALNLQRLAVCYARDDIPFRQRIVTYCVEMRRNSEAIEQQAIVARSYYSQGKVREAISALLQLLMLDKTYYEAYDMLGQCYTKSGNYRRAEQVYYNLRSLDPNDVTAEVRLREITSMRAEMQRGDASSNV